MPLFNVVITIYIGLLVARLLIPMGGEIYFNPLLRAIVRVTEPVLRLARRRVFVTPTGFDLSPLVAAVLLIIGRGFVLGLWNGLETRSALFKSVGTFFDLLYGCWGILLLGLVFTSIGGIFAYSRISQMIMAVTEPIMRPLRRLTGYRERGLDWAPLIGLIVLVAVRTAVVMAIFHMTGARTEVLNTSRVALLSTTILLNALITFLMVIMIARAALSWINTDPYSPLVQTIMFFSDPILTPIRRIVPAWTVGLDFSPLFGMILLMVLRLVVNRIT